MNAAEVSFQRHYPIALKALAEHMLEHNLPAPSDIYTAEVLVDGRRVQAIRVHLHGEHTHLPWVSSVGVDATETEPVDGGRGLRVEWYVRLPGSGIQFRLVGHRAHSLSSVPA